jgi:5-formyltetrahydrofolate cyclo-ligase
MSGFSMGELLLILILCLVFLDPKDAGKFWGRVQRWKKQFHDLTDSVKTELAATVAEPVAQATSVLATSEWWNETDPATLRKWAHERLAIVDQEKLEVTPGQVLARLSQWPVWNQAQDIALFAATKGEIPTQALMEAALSQGKRVWMPWIGNEPGQMDFAPIQGPGDLEPGRFGILCPLEALRTVHEVPAGMLVLVPGLVFDHHGHRIGRGKGYYDRWLARHPQVVRAGLCFDVQVHPARLVPAPHDMAMQHLVTEYRLESF